MMMHLVKARHRLLIAAILAGSLAAAGALANPGGGGGSSSGGGSSGGGNSGGGSSAGGSSSGGNPSGQDSGTNSTGNTGINNLNCREGFVVDPQKHICVRASLDVTPDAELTNYAFSLAEQGRYEEALATLDLLKDPNTAIALNYRGYATRKAGRVDEGIAYYLQAVAIDPAYPQVREYLGEAYVSQGKFDLANEQLVVIASLCGTTCESYTDLAEAIAAAH
jgi:tetratricopeptide (TPR) repeat protein